MVRIAVTRLSSVICLIAILVKVGAYAPSGVPQLVSGRTRWGPSSPCAFTRQVYRRQRQHNDLQQQCVITTTADAIRSRSSTLLSATDPDAGNSDQEYTPSTSKSDSDGPVNSDQEDTPSISKSDSDGTVMDDITSLGTQAILLVVAALVAYVVATAAMTNTTQFATTFLASLSQTFWDAIENLPEIAGAIVSALFDALKLLLPVLEKLGTSVYENALPIIEEISQRAFEASGPVVQDTVSLIGETFEAAGPVVQDTASVIGETSQRAFEAAAPVIQDIASRVADEAGPLLEEAAKTANEAAAPYVDQLNAAVETTILAPLQETKVSVDTQIQDATRAVGDAVDGQIQGATKAVSDAVQSNAQQAGKAIDAQIQGATKTLGDAIDAQIQRIEP